MKRCLLILSVIAALVCSCAGTSAEDIVVAFDVTDPQLKEVVIVCHTSMIPVQLDDQGHGEAVLTGMDAVYAKVYYGRNMKNVYLEAGDCPLISFDPNDFDGTFRFEGGKDGAVEYLNTIILTPLPDEAYALDLDEFMARTEAKEAEAVKLLEASGLGREGDFVRMEKARIHYAYGATVLMYPIGHAMMARDASYMPGEDYFALVEEYMVDDEALVDLDEYRNFVIEAAHVLDPDNRKVTAIYPKTVAQMRFIADRFETPEVRQTLLHYLAVSYVDQFGTDDIQDLENIYRTYVKDTVLTADYAAKSEKWNLSKPGRLSPDFKATGLDGKEWTLADFRGKYVYIDLWATWCNPCKREFPHLKQLEADFKDAQITFLGLSTDRDKGKWEEMVRSGVLSGVQLYLGPGSSFQKAYKIDGIPRFILLDKEGRIISNDMSRPSSEETKAFLEGLEGIR